MERVAVFVDAGYLFAQGSVAIAGSKTPRTQVVLSEAAVPPPVERVGRILSASGAARQFVVVQRPDVDSFTLNHLRRIAQLRGAVIVCERRPPVEIA